VLTCVLGLLSACGDTRRPTESGSAPPSAVEPSAVAVPASPSGAATPPQADAPAAATASADPKHDDAFAPGALVEVWAVDGELARGYEPLPFEPPSWSFVWLSSARSPEPLGGASWVARIRGVFECDAAAARELELDLPAGARFTLDGEARIDELASAARGPRRVELGELAAGAHAFELLTWGRSEDTELSLAWRRGGENEWRPLARGDWAHERSLPRTVPGVKRLKRPLGRRPGWTATTPVAACEVVETLACSNLPERATGLASPAAERWFVLGRGARAAVALVERKAGTLTAERTFASGLDRPGGIAVSDQRVFVLQRNELTELVDRDGDGSADEYRVAFEIPGRDGAHPCGLAVDQGLAAMLFETDRGVRAAIASLADGKTVWHDLRGATHACVSAGFDGAFLVVASGREPAQARAAWLGLVAERAWSVELGAALDALGAQDAAAAPFALVERSATRASYRSPVCSLAVSRVADGFDVGIASSDSTGSSGGAGGTACACEGTVSFLDSRSSSLRVVQRAPDATRWLATTSHPNAIEIELSAPLALDSGWEPEAWSVERDALRPPAWVSVSADRLRVAVGANSGAPTSVSSIAPLSDALGRGFRVSTAVVHVATTLVERASFERAPLPSGVRNVLSADERSAGWRLLFDGTSTAGWHEYGRSGAVVGWAAVDGELARVADGGADLVTDELFESFELEFDWRLWPGGNSGVLFHVVDGFDFVWRTGPEYQLLDDERHADGQNPLTSAGANYALDAPAYDDTHPIGQWNHARLVVDGAHVEHWLNGEPQCEYELWSDAWKARVAGSKFGQMPDYGLARTGRIALQDHGDRVAFKNVKVRTLAR
jgi:hypothetical protein